MSRLRRSPGERLLDRRHNILFFREPSDSRLLLRRRHKAFCGTDEAVAPALEGLDIAYGSGAAPHLGVHRRGPENPLRAGEDRGREQVVTQSYRGPCHRVCGRRGHEDEIRPAGQGDVLDAARALPPGHVRVDLPAGRDGERLFGDKAEGRRGGDDPDLVSVLSEAPDHPRRLVRRDAPRCPDEYAGHANSIQSRRAGTLFRPYRSEELTRSISTRTFSGKMRAIFYRERQQWLAVSVWGLYG